MKARQRRPWFLPPIWFVMVMMIFGVYGTSLLYDMLVHHLSLSIGLLGLSLLSLSVLLLGTPLAMARYLRKAAKNRT